MKEPLAITAFESSTGARVYRLPVEAFPNMWANLYLVDNGDMLALIDTGSGSDKSNEDLLNGILESGYRLSDITHILLTHGHIDHYGGLVFLRRKTKAQIAVHELDRQTISQHETHSALISHRLGSFLIQAGVPDDQRDHFLQMSRFTKYLFHSVPVNFTYDSVGMQVGSLEMIHVPGHCPGHVAIKLDDIVFCGDLILEHITPHQSPEELIPFLGVRHYLNSLSLLQTWATDARLVLNGHDDLITDLPLRIQNTRQRLFHRIRQTLKAFSVPRTVAEVTDQVYGKMGGYNALLVIEKIGAYVEYLYQRGLLDIANPAEIDSGRQITPILYCRNQDGRKLEILSKERAYVFV